ncbi:MAG: ATP-dependent 6-phosphofructokinase [Acidimicrobiia bacterium]|nr:ATP-dependent 6-phosphofructokinase [Acidimicrobiia bacterium]
MNIGILTAGGDAPGLNAAIRAVGKAASRRHGMGVVGFLDGFRGLMENRTVRLDSDTLSGILTRGGTILGTSRDKPHKMEIGGKTLDMTDAMVENAARHELAGLVCLGGGGTQKNALRLADKGLNVITLPKTIDNDVALTDRTFGFDTALTIATEAVDRLHSTAHSHHRIMVVEIMGHNAGWLTLGAGLGGGADVILIPEIPYETKAVADALLERKAAGSRFSLVAVSEGAVTREDHDRRRRLADARSESSDDEERAALKAEIASIESAQDDSTVRLSRDLQEMTGLQSRVTILGHVQRGGTPSPKDRLLATRLGTAAADFAAEGRWGIMVASRGDTTIPVPLADVAGNRRTVPLDHPWLDSARALGVSLGE